MTKAALVWLRSDLRLADNPALAAACSEDGPVLALYVHETDPGIRPIGGAARWWLHHSLQDLAKRLAAVGIALKVETGRASEIVPAAVRLHKATSVFWNRRYGPAERKLDTRIEKALSSKDVHVHTFSANVLVEPGDVTTGEGKPFSVFTPFAKALRRHEIATPVPAPNGRHAIRALAVDKDYEAPFWSRKFGQYWSIGEEAALERLDDFLDEGLTDYPEGRDRPAKDATSRLSPHLRFGEISPRQVWHATLAHAAHRHGRKGAADKFLTELSWRDFNIVQLFHRPDIAKHAMQPRFDGMPWRHSASDFKAWTRGETGIPIVDAGMRELWETGYMQNRVRLLTASLLAKNLMIDWRDGEEWFWDCLMDADPANNPGNWQWVAGSGLDAAPYFRIFNPVTQGERFDEGGAYVRRWLPELGDLPDKFIQRPFEAPPDVLGKAGVTLGKTYPKPIVDLKESRERALAAFKKL